MRILVVEDDKVLHHLIAKRLKEEGHSVDDCYDGESGFDYADSMQYDCIILDLMLPKRDGISILRELRNKGNASPVLILTERDSIDDRVVGLDAGADDYLVKPFAYERFQLALEHFCQRREAIQNGTINQGLLDRALFSDAHGNLSASASVPPKGLQAQTLERIEGYLRSKPEEKHTSDDIASHVGLSVVTVRRYMNYLSEQHIVESEMDYSTGGRPCIVYRSLPEQG